MEDTSATLNEMLGIGMGVAKRIMDTGAAQAEEVDAVSKQISDAIRGHSHAVAWCALGAVIAQLLIDFAKINDGMVNKQAAQIIMTMIISRLMSAIETYEEGQNGGENAGAKLN